MKKILIIGGSNIDYIGKSDHKLNNKDSNIGSISISFGGVARNICENLARLKCQPTFVTAVGNDMLAQTLLQELKDLNVKVINPDSRDYKTGGYLAIHGCDGDMALALCDQRIIDLISIDYLKTLEHKFLEADIIVTDANLNQDVVEYIINNYRDKIVVCDAISVSKVKKLENVIDKISLLKCNLLEAKSLLNKDLEPYELAQEFIKRNAKTVVITNSDKEVIYVEDKKVKTSRVFKVNEKDIVNLTGVGDAMLSGIIYALANDLTIEEAIRLGKEASIITLKSSKATSPEIYKLIEKKELKH